MKITCAWGVDPTDPSAMPTLLSTFDEYTEDAWGGTPDFHLVAVASAKKDMDVRECVIWVPDSPIDDLFKVPEIQGSVREKT